MKYLAFLRHPETLQKVPPPPEFGAAMGQFVQKAFQEGSVVDTGGLLPSQDGFRVRVADGCLTVTDGPFTEAREMIGGWAILRADSKAEAQRITKEFMELHRRHWPGFVGESEVLAIMEPGEVQAGQPCAGSGAQPAAARGTG